MRRPRRKRASITLLVVLGLFAAGAAAAAGAPEMPCCQGMSPAHGCVWLGAVDCCSERPAASAPANAAVSAPPAGAGTVTSAAALRETPALTRDPCTLPIPTRRVVLRL